jgi:hypothetical protein
METSYPSKYKNKRRDIQKNLSIDSYIIITRSYYRKESAAVWRHEPNAKE